MAKRIGHKWQPADYTSFYLLDEPTHSAIEIRREYTRMRDIAMKRADRLAKAGLKTQAEYIRKMLPTIKGLREQHAAEPTRTFTGKRDKKGHPISRPLTWEEEIAKRLSTSWNISQESAYSLKAIKQLRENIEKDTGERVPLREVLPFNQYMQSWRTSAFFKTMVGSAEASDYHDNEYKKYGGSFASFYTLYYIETYGHPPVGGENAAV